MFLLCAKYDVSIPHYGGYSGLSLYDSGSCASPVVAGSVAPNMDSVVGERGGSFQAALDAGKLVGCARDRGGGDDRPHTGQWGELELGAV